MPRYMTSSADARGFSLRRAAVAAAATLLVCAATLARAAPAPTASTNAASTTQTSPATATAEHSTLATTTTATSLDAYRASLSHSSSSTLTQSSLSPTNWSSSSRSAPTAHTWTASPTLFSTSTHTNATSSTSKTISASSASPSTSWEPPPPTTTVIKPTPGGAVQGVPVFFTTIRNGFGVIQQGSVCSLGLSGVLFSAQPAGSSSPGLVGGTIALCASGSMTDTVYAASWSDDANDFVFVLYYGSSGAFVTAINTAALSMTAMPPIDPRVGQSTAIGIAFSDTDATAQFLLMSPATGVWATTIDARFMSRDARDASAASFGTDSPEFTKLRGVRDGETILEMATGGQWAYIIGTRGAPDSFFVEKIDPRGAGNQDAPVEATFDAPSSVVLGPLRFNRVGLLKRRSITVCGSAVFVALTLESGCGLTVLALSADTLEIQGQSSVLISAFDKLVSLSCLSSRAVRSSDPDFAGIAILARPDGGGNTYVVTADDKLTPSPQKKAPEVSAASQSPGLDGSSPGSVPQRIPGPLPSYVSIGLVTDAESAAIGILRMSAQSLNDWHVDLVPPAFFEGATPSQTSCVAGYFFNPPTNSCVLCSAVSDKPTPCQLSPGTTEKKPGTNSANSSASMSPIVKILLVFVGFVAAVLLIGAALFYIRGPRSGSDDDTDPTPSPSSPADVSGSQALLAPLPQPPHIPVDQGMAGISVPPALELGPRRHPQLSRIAPNHQTANQIGPASLSDSDMSPITPTTRNPTDRRLPVAADRGASFALASMLDITASEASMCSVVEKDSMGAVLPPPEFRQMRLRTLDGNEFAQMPAEIDRTTRDPSRQTLALGSVQSIGTADHAGRANLAVGSMLQVPLDSQAFQRKVSVITVQSLSDSQSVHIDIATPESLDADVAGAAEQQEQDRDIGDDAEKQVRPLTAGLPTSWFPWRVSESQDSIDSQDESVSIEEIATSPRIPKRSSAEEDDAIVRIYERRLKDLQDDDRVRYHALPIGVSATGSLQLTPSTTSVGSRSLLTARSQSPGVLRSQSAAMAASSRPICEEDYGYDDDGTPRRTATGKHFHWSGHRRRSLTTGPTDRARRAGGASSCAPPIQPKSLLRLRAQMKRDTATPDPSAADAFAAHATSTLAPAHEREGIRRRSKSLHDRSLAGGLDDEFDRRATNSVEAADHARRGWIKSLRASKPMRQVLSASAPSLSASAVTGIDGRVDLNGNTLGAHDAGAHNTAAGRPASAALSLGSLYSQARSDSLSLSQ
ncbi:hypothetical protein HK105_200917 [Polyrhizophydium stewartii]|uniref:Transmembrane protein n=1 Tax=Polyrhizophydium stewartii TaxID=2732419 RepID=A0ABR4NII0_9FUNG